MHKLPGDIALSPRSWDAASGFGQVSVEVVREGVVRKAPHAGFVPHPDAAPAVRRYPRIEGGAGGLGVFCTPPSGSRATAAAFGKDQAETSLIPNTDSPAPS